mmetsp:Transcript_201/g.624  ORF Transcript_201/g.624 Transcript_201/m.624 type:complete len:204 (-) Transcript_201:1030-1641(-)
MCSSTFSVSVSMCCLILSSFSRCFRRASLYVNCRNASLSSSRCRSASASTALSPSSNSRWRSFRESSLSRMLRMRPYSRSSALDLARSIFAWKSSLAAFVNTRSCSSRIRLNSVRRASSASIARLMASTFSRCQSKIPRVCAWYASFCRIFSSICSRISRSAIRSRRRFSAANASMRKRSCFAIRALSAFSNSNRRNSALVFS